MVVDRWMEEYVNGPVSAGGRKAGGKQRRESGTKGSGRGGICKLS